MNFLTPRRDGHKHLSGTHPNIAIHVMTDTGAAAGGKKLPNTLVGVNHKRGGGEPKTRL